MRKSRFNKNLGQNFFVNKGLGKKIADIVSDTKIQSIIEIGPGEGFFTKLLSPNFNSYAAIEKDDHLADNLQKQFKDITVVNIDFLDFNFENITEKTTCFGSLPYNISKRIITKCIEDFDRFDLMYFIIQKEVAQKYVGTAPNSSIISLTTSIFANVEILFHISPGSFVPQPKVTSSFIKITPNNNLKKIEDPKKLIGIIKQAFGRPRKKLRNNLRNVTGIDEKLLNMRPQELSLEDYIKIVQLDK